MTSQTCINILLDRSDLQKAYRHLRSQAAEGIDAFEPVEKTGLVAIVGEGLDSAEGLVARVIQALARVNVHAEMIVAGASKVAAYFLVDEEKLKRAVISVHEAFFPRPDESGKA